MKIFAIISIFLNITFIYYLIHDTNYYKKVIKDLQAKYTESLKNPII